METAREQPTYEHPPLQSYTRHTQNNAQSKAPKPDEQYLKSITLNVPTFDGRLEPQIFLDWRQEMDVYIPFLSLERLGSLP